MTKESNKDDNLFKRWQMDNEHYKDSRSFNNPELSEEKRQEIEKKFGIKIQRNKNFNLD